MGVLGVIFGAVGGFSLFYYVVMIVTYGAFDIAFSKFWLAVGIIGILLSIILRKLQMMEIKINRNLGIGLMILTAIVLGSFAIVEGNIIITGNKKPVEEADYLIVLGAQVRGDVPSNSLQLRIDGAAEYMKENENTTAIASGGKGSGENISEAEAIKLGLIENGIDEDRIIMEDKSTSTVENLKNSSGYVTNKDSSVVIVTNRFHIMRACFIAKKLGFKNTYGYAVNSNPVLALNCYVREFFAVVKDKVVGNI